ncbi:hypothetical protein NDU88_007437 [Pleurodeles waltl]|uniref:Uncharacterized protein n=1 Tax=Pleurodeles waltl TaxID=8319 RepID=A0AAV7VQT1_PLEWA|nr:hypothetical protein NDU88_007437 [Pleurodeles waltl]
MPFVRRKPLPMQVEQWKAWVEHLEIYYAALAIEDGCKRPLLLHVVQEYVYKLSKNIKAIGPPFTYNTLKAVLTAHIEPLANTDYKRFVLHQAPAESEDTF